MEHLLEILANSIVPVLAGTVFGLVCIGFGAIFVRYFTTNKRPPLFESFILGTIAISLLTFAWGSLGWMGMPDRWSLGGPVILLSLFAWIKYRPTIPIDFRNYIKNPVVILILIHMAVLLITMLLRAMYPPMAWDECNSHLPVAKELIDSGRLTFHQEINFNNFPQNTEMLFAWLISVSTLSSSHMVNVLAFIFILLGIIRLGHSMLSLWIGLITVVLLGRSGGLQHSATHGFVDIWVIVYVTAALLAVVEAFKNQEPKKLVLAGIFLGGAAGVKYTSMLAALTLVLAIPAIGTWRPGDGKPFPIKYIAGFFIMAILIAMPWYIRNYAWFHNPVFPFYANIFPSGGGKFGYLADDLVTNHKQMLQYFTIEYQLKEGQFWKVILGQKQVWLGMVLVLWFWRKTPFIRFSIVWIALSWIFWLTAMGGLLNYRYYAYLIPINALLAVYFLSEIYNRLQDRFKKLVKVLICIFLLFMISAHFKLIGEIIPPLTSDAQKEYICNLEFHSFSLILEANRVIPDGENAVGIWCEDGRVYADFVLNGGGHHGWANSTVIGEACDSAENLAGLLRNKFNSEYLIINLQRLEMVDNEPLIPLKALMVSQEFYHCFKQVGMHSTGVIFHVECPD